MSPDAIARVAAAINDADRAGGHLDRLPDGCSPATVAEALAVQEYVVANSGQTVAGWKLARMDDTVCWGTIYARDLLDAPARVPAARFPVMGVEAEIAYRFRTDLPRGDEPLSEDRVAALLEPVPAFEIVDSRFSDYKGTPVLDRMCDRMSNGALVVGRWQAPVPEDFAEMVVRLDRDGKPLFEGAGSHVRKDPLIPALEFIADQHAHRDFRAGQFLTTGTFTGLIFGHAGESYAADFGGRAEVTLEFEAKTGI
ncbi:MAG: hypothetical protein KDJ77_10475 [Rhodobiaceae bacterium]|nr:hypothetical protein [Rhodobiaceae bacterium]